MTVRVEWIEQVEVLVLDRPHRANAYDQATLLALDEAVASVRGHVAVIASAGDRAFCGGADLTELGAATAADALELRSQAVFERLCRAPFVSIAAVQGPAVAGGFELALACDLRVLGPRATFSLPETSLGILPSAGGTTRLTAMVGPGRAREVILGGRVLCAADAVTWGLAARVVDEPLAEAVAWAQRIAESRPLALRMAKRVLDAVEDRGPGLAMERATEAVLYASRGEE